MKSVDTLKQILESGRFDAELYYDGKRVEYPGCIFFEQTDNEYTAIFGPESPITLFVSHTQEAYQANSDITLSFGILLFVVEKISLEPSFGNPCYSLSTSDVVFNIYPR